MEVKAIAKWVRISGRKVRRIAALIRKKNAKESLAMLKFMPQKGARVLEKVLKSAIANAKNNFKLNEAKLVVSHAMIDECAPYVRFQARARGRAFMIKKRNCHVTICLLEKS